MLNKHRANIKHISFDVWNTLITPNKQYSTERNKAIAEFYDIPVQEAKEAYSTCKTFLDNTAEISGFGMSVQNNWLLLERTLKTFSVNQNRLINTCSDLFKQYPPHFDEELKKELINLKENGYTLSIKSNTNFVAGSVLNAVLFNELDVFSFTHYSDEFEMAKPSAEFFSATVQASGNIPCTILHIGDNIVTDGNCLKYHWNFAQVHNPANLLLKLKRQEIL